MIVENVVYFCKCITAKFDYSTTEVTESEDVDTVKPLKLSMAFRTERKLPKTSYACWLGRKQWNNCDCKRLL